ncbi:MBL fold metallo-hydrolase [Roseomonas sp. CCTCC AB2023176]|uniref:MBL fold metallo-hydrolase n=1 Tax=Roseomonas sp. CCTCC AB2023176 TaxID=3342640 RepID=UPI0035D70DD8
MMREGSGTPWPDWIEDPPQPRPTEPPPGHVAVTFVGHSTFLIRFAGGPTLLTDPIWSERCSPLSFLGPRRVRRPGLALDALPPLDAVLLSHNHYDHMDLPTLRRLRAPLILTGLGNTAILDRAGVVGGEDLDWWESRDVAGAAITYVPMRHFSARGIRDRGKALWGGFAVHTAAGALIFCGDTGYGPHLAEVGARLGPFAVGLVPIGAYEPRWFMQVVHMNPEEALHAQSDLRVGTAIAMHFGTFKLTQEGVEAPAEALRAGRAASGLRAEGFRVPLVGETLILPLSAA